MHQPAHQLGDVIVNIERIYVYTPDRARSAIRIIITKRPISLVRSSVANDGGEGDKSPIRDENDEEVPHKANAGEKREKRDGVKVCKRPKDRRREKKGEQDEDN